MINAACPCQQIAHTGKRVVLTGGPGAGKTAVLEVVRRTFCEHVVVLPESASIVFGGGFPRKPTECGRRAAQRAIFHVQVELERLSEDPEAGKSSAVTLCDRGTIDGVAYWPGAPETFWSALSTSLEAQILRYAAVIHLRTPSLDGGYNLRNPVRIESAREAADIDARIEQAWSTHPRRFFVDASDDFLVKTARALALIEAEIPPCCRPGGGPEKHSI